MRLGELHVVFAHLRAIGHFIGNSGIDDMWIETDVFGPNHIKSILACTHMKRAIKVHEATLLAMYKMYFHLLLKDHPDVVARHDSSIRKSITDLNTACKLQEVESVQMHHSDLKRAMLEFNFISTMKSFDKERSGNSMFQAIRIYMNMVERLLLFLQASRMKDWELHLAAGEDLIKDFFSMDRINYRRLMPVYIANMRALESDEPEIWNAMRNGQFSVQKRKIPFTSIGVDHAGERINKLIKVDGGLTGISSNENARARWMLIAPVVLKFIDDMGDVLMIHQMAQERITN